MGREHVDGGRMEFETGIPMSRGGAVTEGPSLSPSLNQGVLV